MPSEIFDLVKGLPGQPTLIKLLLSAIWILVSTVGLWFLWVPPTKLESPNVNSSSDQEVSRLPKKTEGFPSLNVTGNNTVISVGQSGGQTAHTIINRALQREISDSQRRVFIDASRNQPGLTDAVAVRLNDGSNEGRRYLKNLLRLLHDAGWTNARSQGEMVNTLPPFEGLHIEVGDISNLPVVVRTLKHAFERAGIEFQITRGPTPWKASDFRLTIGPVPSVDMG